METCKQKCESEEAWVIIHYQILHQQRTTSLGATLLLSASFFVADVFHQLLLNVQSSQREQLFLDWKVSQPLLPLPSSNFQVVESLQDVLKVCTGTNVHPGVNTNRELEVPSQHQEEPGETPR